MVSGVRQEDSYIAIQYLNKTEKYSVEKLCESLHVCRSAYYKWLKREPIQHQRTNEQLVEWIKELYEEQNGILGYRQMTITINRVHETKYNIKRIRRLMQILHLQSVCRRKKYNYIKSTPEVTAENVLNREFYADAPNEKWLTDVTEFKYYVGEETKKLYLSAILDLYDRRIVLYKIGASNNNPLVFETFDEAKEVMTQNIDYIESVADEVLKENCFSYVCNAYIDNEYFPTRVYDGLTLEEGWYDALILNLGNGYGDNWWCLVYPAFCFTITQNFDNVVYISKIWEIIKNVF